MARVRRRFRVGACALLLAAAATSAAAPAGDACPLQTVYALTQASLLPAGDDVPLVAQACRVWSHDPAVALAAVAYPLPVAADGDGRTLRLVVAVLDAHDAAVLAVHEAELAEDAAFALSGDGLKLDTAGYVLAPGVRAFGVRVRSAAPGPSCPDRRANDELTLYVRQGPALRPVFTSHTDFWSRIEGEPCSWAQGQRLVTEEAAFTIDVGPDSHRGYADLRVTADVARIESATGSDQDRTVRRRASRVLRYDGARYDADALEHGFFWTQDK